MSGTVGLSVCYNIENVQEQHQVGLSVCACVCVRCWKLVLNDRYGVRALCGMFTRFCTKL